MVGDCHIQIVKELDSDQRSLYFPIRCQHGCGTNIIQFSRVFKFPGVSHIVYMFAAICFNILSFFYFDCLLQFEYTIGIMVSPTVFFLCFRI